MKRIIALGMFLVVVFGLSITANAVLVGHWTFDENMGTTAYDSSVFGNTGTINEARWVEGKYGSGLNFDGVDDYVVIPKLLWVAVGMPVTRHPPHLG
jgi:hypothetical protein